MIGGTRNYWQTISSHKTSSNNSTTIGKCCSWRSIDVESGTREAINVLHIAIIVNNLEGNIEKTVGNDVCCRNGGYMRRREIRNNEIK